MATVTISDDLYDRLDAVARSKRVPVEELIETLLVLWATSNRRGEELVRRFGAIAALTPIGVPQSDSVELIREDRDR